MTKNLKKNVPTVKLKPQESGEIIFDIAYLLFAIFSGIFFLSQGQENKPLFLYGVLAVTLGLGDAFHLLPRVYSLYTGTMKTNYKALGFGKMITSVTMTVFYVLLYMIWQQMYKVSLPIWITSVVLVLASIRIILCICPQNGWLSENPPFRFGIYRNIPFFILGAVVAVLYAFSGLKGSGDGFGFMAPAIILSFIFYFIVVMFSGKNKMLGMFMLPKTCMYIWMIGMGYHLIP